MSRLWIGVALGLGLGIASCTRSPGSVSGAAPSAPALVARGRVVYSSSCIACHNPDPSKPGGLGPEIKGSSRALLEARILKGTYPEGYTPKRTTHLMAPLPHLASDLDALTAFLNQ